MTGDADVEPFEIDSTSNKSDRHLPCEEDLSSNDEMVVDENDFNQVCDIVPDIPNQDIGKVESPKAKPRIKLQIGKLIQEQHILKQTGEHIMVYQFLNTKDNAPAAMELEMLKQ